MIILNLSIKFHHIQHDMKNSSNLKCIILYIVYNFYKNWKIMNKNQKPMKFTKTINEKFLREMIK